jgi:hypothetical protein
VVVRGVKSWWLGITSGLWFLPFVVTFLILSATPYRFRHRLLAAVIAILASVVLSTWHHCRAIARSRHVPDEKDIQVSTAVKNVAGTDLSESDDPIQSWSEDSLGRAALVDSLSIKLLISKAPVIALFGEFGSGKTSILNLLREHLEGKVIVVSFSTWLPGSQETLPSYLMADIANECQKQYMVPGLRKSAGRLANALAQNVPFLKGFPELFPAATQSDDIESLKLALMRLSEAGMFPAYFRYDLPAAIFSTVELETFIQNSTDAADETERRKLFSDELSSMEKGSLKRDDFLRKLSDVAPKVPLSVAQVWVDAGMSEARNVTYDSMMAFGEAGHIYRMVARIAQKMSKSKRLAFLEKCITEATDDTMAFRLLTQLTADQNPFNLDMSLSELYPSFIRRMRTRYGREVDAEHVISQLGTPQLSTLGECSFFRSTAWSLIRKIATFSMTSGDATSGTTG